MSINEPLYETNKVREKEEFNLLTEQKSDFLKKINDIYNKVENKEKNINQFLYEANEEKYLGNQQYLKFQELGQFRLFLLVKVMSILFFSIHLIGVYVINGIISAIEEELIAASKSYIKKRAREPIDDFYQNFNKLNNRFPDYSMFYISSFLTDYLNGCFGYIILTIFWSIINFIVLFFGFRNYIFNIDRLNYKNYNLNEFIYLYIIYLLLCIKQGITALLPLQIIKKGFELYDKFNIKRKNSERNKKGKNEENSLNNINISVNIIEEKENDNNISKNN